jgi:hypothetical protein
MFITLGRRVVPTSQLTPAGSAGARKPPLVAILQRLLATQAEYKTSTFP